MLTGIIPQYSIIITDKRFDEVFQTSKYINVSFKEV